jgi:hypothetical protein
MSSNYERTTDNIFDLEDVRRRHQEAGGTARSMSKVAIVDSIPGIELSDAINPGDAVNEIDQDIADRDPILLPPTVQTGDHSM